MSDLNKPPDANTTMNMTPEQRSNMIWVTVFGRLTDPDNNGLVGRVKILEGYYRSPDDLRKMLSKIANQEVEKELAEFVEKEKKRIKKITNNFFKIVGVIFTVLIPLIPTYWLIIDKFMNR